MILLELFITFLKIGLFTIGGGYAMIPLISEEVVSKGWMSLGELIDFIGISESTPGPFAINISTFIGENMAGLPGAFFSTFGVVLPSFVIILFIAKYFNNIKDNLYVKSAMDAIRPVTIGLILSSSFVILKENVFEITGEAGYIFNYKNVIILAILITIKYFYKKIHPILLIGISAGLGILIYSFIP